MSDNPAIIAPPEPPPAKQTARKTTPKAPKPATLKGPKLGLTRKGEYHFTLIFSNILYGINFSYFVSLIRNYLNFETIFILQVVVSALFFTPFALFSRRYRISWSDFGTILLVTLLIVYGGMYMLLWGARYTNPIDASTISTLGPAFTLITASLLHRERISAYRTTGVILSLIGAWILLFDKGNHIIHGSEAYGNLLVLGSVICVAVNTVIIKPVLVRLGTLVVMGWYYIIGLVITLPFFYRYLFYTDYAQMPLNAILEISYILILGTVLPSYLLYKGTEKLTSVHTALYRYLQPIVATIVAVSRGQENLDRNNIIAAAFIFTGIVMVVTAYEHVRKQFDKVFGIRNQRKEEPAAGSGRLPEPDDTATMPPEESTQD